MAPVSDTHQPHSSPAFLSASGQLQRLPLAPNRRRPQDFMRSYESHALVYDCFWDFRTERVILVGPPAHNLEPHWRAARFGSGRAELTVQFFPSRSTLLVALAGVPASADEITLELGGQQFTLPIRSNESAGLSGHSVLVTMNKDNDLAWIAGWARWHVRMHGADACLFFDNGSTRYGPAEVVETLLSAGIAEPRVLCWPHKYGRKDPAVINRPHYPHFLQVSSLNVALRRFAMNAKGLLNCDIDELVSAEEGNVFDAAKTSPNGVVTLKGNWIEPVEEAVEAHGIPHLRYRRTHRFPLFSVCANKWVLDPSRDWVADLEAKPSVHRIYDVPPGLGADAPVRRFFHFKAINTGWKESRRSHRSLSWLLKRVGALDADAARYARGRALVSGLSFARPT